MIYLPMFLVLVSTVSALVLSIRDQRQRDRQRSHSNARVLHEYRRIARREPDRITEKIDR